MSREFPRVNNARFMAAWAPTPPGKRRPPGKPRASTIPPCRACGAPATHRVWVEVNWFRGDDEGPFNACKLHKESAAELLDPPAKDSP